MGLPPLQLVEPHLMQQLAHRLRFLKLQLEQLSIALESQQIP
jgi:hypothetical protein